MEATLNSRQRTMVNLYPLLMKLTRWLGKNNKILHNTKNTAPLQPIYNLSITLNNGTEKGLYHWKGKKLLLVNTASNCGYTAQFAELQQLQNEHPNLVVIGFPANDFKEQEKGSDADIAQFCQVNFGVTFPLARKSSVVKGPQQNSIYQWLTQPAQNGWNSHAPSWNFSKYLVNEQGVLTHYFDPSVSPLGKEIKKALEG